MVDWATVCKPKELGGLGILNTKLMNIALMLKWVWKLYQNDEGLWADLIRAKYLRGRDLFSKETSANGSQFWKSIQKLKWFFKLGAKHEVRNGKRTFFWLDWWSGTTPLRARFPLLFACCADPFLTVHDARVEGGYRENGVSGSGDCSVSLRRLNGITCAERYRRFPLRLRRTVFPGRSRTMGSSRRDQFILACRRGRR
jgi:hypothetical protein